MGSTSAVSRADATAIGGHLLQDDEPGRASPRNISTKSVHHPVTRINGDRIQFADLARFAWPTKTEANLAFIARVDARTARRWLAGDTEPPAEALGAILAEIMRRYHQR